MSKSKRSRKARQTPRRADPTRPEDAKPLSDPAVSGEADTAYGTRRIMFGSDGRMEDIEFRLAASAPTGASPEDSRTLAELAESVMKAASEEPSQPPESSTQESEPVDENAAALTDPPPDEPFEAPQPRSRGRWAAVVVVALLLFAGGAVALGSGLGDRVSNAGSPESAALPPKDEPPGEDTGVLPAGDETFQAVVADPTPSPVPTHELALAPAPTATPTPAPADTPTSEPTAAPTSKPTAAPAPSGTHVGNLVSGVEEVGRGQKVKVSVKVYVHDDAHGPIGGASVSGEWTGASGSTSCTTGATGSCVVQAGPLSVPGSVTFTVTGVTYEGYHYKPAVNHDGDGGESNGTSVTVTF